MVYNLVEAAAILRIPESTVYSHLFHTNVKSYAIVGSWGPHVLATQMKLESFYKDILNSPTFNVDKDGFQ
jgi:hypothetical protein